MRVAHILRKYNPAEWGGTETAVQQLLDGLRPQQVESTVYAPRLQRSCAPDPIQAAGHRVRRYRATVPVFNLDPEQREQLIAVGGNVLSLDLLMFLLLHRKLDLIHSHAINRIGGAALTAASVRRVPLLVTIHGGVLDLPNAVREALAAPLEGGREWGKLFGAIFRSRQVLKRADAIITCNPREAALQREKFPGKRVVLQPHGVPIDRFGRDHKAAALHAFPTVGARRIILIVGRIDPVKNQGWVLVQMPEILARFPDAMLVLAGACTDELYGKALRKEVKRLGLEQRILFTGGLPPGDPRLIGLMQRASVVVVPSLSETFGLVILEAWAAGAPVISSRTSGALSLIKHEENGVLFDLENPGQFQAALNTVLSASARSRDMAATGHALVTRQYDAALLAKRIKSLYDEVIEEKRRR